jgi:hypothetical protein
MTRFVQTKDSPLLLSEDLPSLKSQRLKVALLMLDLFWHTRFEIEKVAGGAEGMRRMRELRQRGWEIEKRRIEGRRAWQYRATYIPEVDYKILREML